MKQIITIAAISLVMSVAVGYALFNKQVTTIVHQDGTTTTVGAYPGPDSSFPCESHNGVTTCSERRALLLGTTTPFAYRTPTATSTLRSLSCATTGATTTGQTFVLTKGSGMQASTTAISNSITVAAGANGSVVASSTPELLRVFNPNSWVQFNAIGGTGTSNLTGTCSIEVTII